MGKSATKAKGRMIDEFGELAGPAGAFIRRNYGMIIRTAEKKFGTNFSIAQMVADALHAFSQMNDYHDGFKTTKDTSSFFWYLNREMDITYTDGIQTERPPASFLSKESGMCDSSDAMLDVAAHRNHRRENDSGLAQEEEFAYGFGEDEDAPGSPVGRQGRNGCRRKTPDEQMEYAPKYVLCMESFKEVLYSPDLSMILKSLSDNHAHKNRQHYEKLVAGRRSIAALSDRIRHNLLLEASRAGYRLYIAVCVNGACSNVLVAGRSEEEATQYLARYGDLVEISPFEPTAGTG
jgi:hypothetical protein